MTSSPVHSAYTSNQSWPGMKPPHSYECMATQTSPSGPISSPPTLRPGQPSGKKSQHMRGPTSLPVHWGPAHPTLGRYWLVCPRPKQKRLPAYWVDAGLGKRWLAGQEGCLIFLLPIAGGAGRLLLVPLSFGGQGQKVPEGRPLPIPRLLLR